MVISGWSKWLRENQPFYCHEPCHNHQNWEKVTGSILCSPLTWPFCFSDTSACDTPLPYCMYCVQLQKYNYLTFEALRDWYQWPARYLFQLSRRDRDFYLPIMWFEIEIEIFTSLSCGSRSRFSRSRFFIIESHVSRRDRDFSSLNLVVRDEIENFHHWILKFETRSRCFSFLSSTNFKPQSREQRMIFP